MAFSCFVEGSQFFFERHFLWKTIFCSLLTSKISTMASALEMDYGTMFAVMDSWEALRRMKDSEEVAGVILFKQ